jgi:4-diphosphocytidyl-2-C-methyl-D-erythritol kinase
MLSFPNAKINLGLNIVAKRTDGFHNIETVFLPINTKDILEIIISENKYIEVDFSSTGLKIDGDTKNNLCIKAYDLLKKEFYLPNIKMHLHKTIPMGAGLGGGSADGAFTLQLLNEKCSLNLSSNQLINYALQLGSDCPFFIINKSCFASSRGEVLQAVSLDLTGFQLVIINPQIHVSTAWAFGKITPKKPLKSILQIIQQPIETWKDDLINDFENPVLDEYPAIKNIKDILYQNNATYAAMTGTGSTVFGIFKKEIEEINFNFPDHYFIKWMPL